MAIKHKTVELVRVDENLTVKEILSNLNFFFHQFQRIQFEFKKEKYRSANVMQIAESIAMCVARRAIGTRVIVIMVL